jgi:CBS domain containing-hemolysin-like protein
MIEIFIGLLMVALTAVFVATEFALVKVNLTKLKKLASEGNKKAQTALRVVSNLDVYLSACQLGITVASLVLGSIGEPAVHHMLGPMFELIHMPEQGILLFSMLFVTLFHVTLGEMVPKTISISYAEKIAMNLVGLLVLFYVMTKPVIWLMNKLCYLVCKLIGLKPANGHGETYSEEELIMLMSDSLEKGEINSSEYKYVSNIFEFDERQAREIMVPRTDMRAIDINDSNEDIFQILSQEKYTRFPVVNNEKDNIVGMIHAKEFFIEYIKNKDFPLESLFRPVMFVSEAKPIRDLLREMQEKQVHFAILTDEYGGTEGLVTIEDILEEIVGEIRDEFDTDERPEVEKINEEEIIVDGKLSIHEVNNLLEANIDEEELETIGGWLYMKKSELKVKEKIKIDNLVFELLERSNTRFKRIKIQKMA